MAGSDSRIERARRGLLRVLNGERQQLAYNWQRIDAAGWPVVFQIELTNHCPMTCQMCPRTHSMERPLGFMDAALFRRIVDQAARSTSRVFLHHFGDSLLHPGIGNCIRYGAERGIDTYLSTNPILLNDARIRALVDNGLKELVLSLDGVTGETARAVRGPAAEDVARAEQWIHSLLEYRRQAGAATPTIIMQIVRQKQNAHEIETWLEKWQNVAGIDRVKVKSYIAWDGREEKINELRIDPEPDPTAVVCDKPWTSITILWDGRVVPCCFDHDATLVLGDATKQSLDEIWHGERARALRDSHRRSDFSRTSLCAHCRDKEGYPVRKWYYPLNRLARQQNPLASEWSPEDQERRGRT
jgi:radical SAM protein with 4Fe4S-binding SPASM domain